MQEQTVLGSMKVKLFKFYQMLSNDTVSPLLVKFTADGNNYDLEN